MEIHEVSFETLDRYRRNFLIGGVVLLAISAIFAFLNPAQFFSSYLFAFMFWLGITLGSLVILMIHQLTGGMWGAVVRRFLEAATRTLPLIALFFLPILLGLHHLYVWTNAEHMAESPILQEKQIYLNIPFFIIRSLIYFAVWFILTYFLNRWSLELDTEDSPGKARRLQALSGPGLILYGLTMTFASVDWMMSLRPEWFSTIYGLLVMTGQVLSAFAFIIAIAAIFSRSKPLSDVISFSQFHDLGNLLLAFVMIWAYLSFSQFLIIWAGNLPEEAEWYVHRLHGWSWIGVLLIVLHFALPFLLLLNRHLKQDPKILSIVAVGVIVMRLIDLFWLISPDTHQGFTIHLLDFILPPALGLIWLFFYLGQLKNRPMIAVHDTNLKEALQHGH